MVLMKESQQCPKCKSKKLWRIEKLEGPGIVPATPRGGHGFPIRLSFRRAARRRRKSFWDFRSIRKGPQTGFIDAWVCDACGYTELYARDFEELKHEPEHGIHFVDAVSDQTTPYR